MSIENHLPLGANRRRIMADKNPIRAILNGEPITRFPRFEDSVLILTPGERNVGGEKQPDGTTIGLDWFGCSWTESATPGPLGGQTPTPGTRRLDDLADFAETIPTADEVRAFNWAGFARQVLEGVDRSEKVVQVRSLTGPFERMHFLVGFEDALCAFYEEPETVEEFFAAMLEYKKAVVDCVVEHIQPDLIIFDDDYGTARAPFMSPDMWREFFPAFWKPLVEYVHSKGVLFELHSCGYITPLVGDFVDLGMDILQPVQTNNDLKYIKENYGDKIVLRLSIFDKQFATLGQTEEEIRADIRGYYETLAPGGKFIPDLVPIQDEYYRIQGEVHAELEQKLLVR